MINNYLYDMRNFIKQVLSEAKSKKILVGCDFFEHHTHDYRWCKFAETKLMRNTNRAKKAMNDYIKIYLSQYTSGLRAVKYNKELEFFSERRSMVVDALDKFKTSCPSLRKYIIDSMVRFTDQYVIWNESQQYDLLNKLNTNYTAQAYMLTANLPDQHKTSVAFEDVLKYFFDEKNADGMTPFEIFMGKIENDNKKEIRDKINDTIAQKTKEGQEIEDKFFEYISNQLGDGSVISYSGDYSFMDMIGIDMVIQTPEGNWVPVQVKKYSGGCDDKTIAHARKYMCENWCVSNESKYWAIKTYNGQRLVKSKQQCKTSELDKTTFLNVHGKPDKTPSYEYCRADDDEQDYYENDFVEIK
jgi:hypothetical protein